MPEESKLTFEKNDLLGLKQFCQRLEQFVLVEHDYVEGSLVIALDGGFGSGKSTFIEMWMSDLLARREKGEFCPMPIILNAWESDYCGDPLVAILSSLVEALDFWQGDDAPENKKELKESAKDVAWYCLALVNGVGAKFTGLDAFKAAEIAEKKQKSRNEEIPDFIALYQSRKKALETLKQRLSDAFSGQAPKVLVCVDELDRCRPDYAISYLETIKHVFNVKGMIFILAIDRPHLEGSARSLFGKDLEFEEYFRKFCHRTVALPALDENAFRRLSGSYISKFIAIEGKRMSMLSPQMDYLDFCKQLAAGLKMRPRQLQEAFRIVGHTMATLEPRLKGQIKWVLGVGTLLLAFLRVKQSDLYRSIARGEANAAEVSRTLKDEFGSNNGEWWVKLYLAGIWGDEAVEVEIQKILTELGYFREGTTVRQQLEDIPLYWGKKNQLQEICMKLECADSF